jgi:hypothetical protein
MTNQKISPTQIVGARENTMFPHTVAGTEPDYRARLPVACECDDGNEHEDAHERHRHCNSRPTPIHRAFVRIPTTPMTIRTIPSAPPRIQTTRRRGVIFRPT